MEKTRGFDEEQDNFDAEPLSSDLDTWFRFVKRSKAKAPENLNDMVWESIQAKKKGSQRFIYGIAAMAASIALIITLSVNDTKQSYREKEALLTEALSMFQNDVKPMVVQHNHIIYEDDLIVIYTNQN